MIKIGTVIVITALFFVIGSHIHVLILNVTSPSKPDFSNNSSFSAQSIVLDLKHNNIDLYKNRIVPIFMLLAGIGIAGIWTADIVKGRFSDQGRFFKWREGENMLWPHLFAEFLTAAALITAGIGLFHAKEWALPGSFWSLGALTYTAINSSGWVIAEKNRMAYGIPMWISLIGAVISFAILLR